MPESNLQPGGKGRPVDSEKQALQKQKLLDAALTLLGEKSFSEITIRELGKQAGVNSAMVSYYFTNKEGLFIALLDKLSEEKFSLLSDLHQHPDPLKAVITLMLDLVNRHPGLMKLIHSEAMSADSRLGEAIIERFPKRMATLLPGVIAGLQAQGKIRKDINPKYAAFSLMSLIVTPFLVTPIRERAWEIGAQELNTTQWTEHIYQLFISGITTGPSQ
ncbi:TetR/AcrR family transcriptional regulator [Thalassomonas viridans]|uniref:TetR/AcrR family transcriptional regulator n=1 Tax=Thalassomonas viridans TaxID=137584 RepID=A0AAE9Z5A0_9GAMM|nr:TetR/AcrR family transcriptional regulator [Thalassomonas viridans]WDE06547.1 TetR/AcrR family transcriptional regulator [Thalassomonas viridans]